SGWTCTSALPASRSTPSSAGADSRSKKGAGIFSLLLHFSGMVLEGPVGSLLFLWAGSAGGVFWSYADPALLNFSVSSPGSTPRPVVIPSARMPTGSESAGRQGAHGQGDDIGSP